MPVALTIATSDSGGGAGIQADLKTFAANGVYGTSAFAALTAQNPDGVVAIEELSPKFLRAQLDQLAAYYPIEAVKTGMLFSAPLIKETACFLRDIGRPPLVVDPVMVATSGAILLKPDAIATLKRELLPLAAVITPNLDEAAVLLRCDRIDAHEMESAARKLSEAFGTAILLKGGHLPGDQLVDLLVQPGKTSLKLESTRIPGVNTHGSGCTLSSAIAAGLAQGLPLSEAVTKAHAYLQRALKNPLPLGDKAFIRHLP